MRRTTRGHKLDASRMNEFPMRLRLNFSWRQRMLADDAVAAYSEWRGECAAVGASYRQWTSGVFPPVRIGDLRLVDGGVVNNTPIEGAKHDDVPR